MTALKEMFAVNALQNRDEGRLQIAMHAVHLFLELWIMTFLDGKP